jgi:3-oxoacyl-[acyl-carrier protein] reductase
MTTPQQYPPALDLTSRVAIVTGGGHGLGRAYVRRLAQRGARVVVAEIDAAAGEQTAGLVADAGGQAIAVPADVTDAASLSALADAAVRAYGRIDVLVNNAAVFATVPISRVPFDQIPEAEWDRVIEVNIKGTWLACQAVVPAMRAAGYGKIINVSSDAWFKGSPLRIHYVSSKAAIVGFTRTLARELGPDGIRVNCVAPGSTLSDDDPSPEAVAMREEKAAEQSIAGVLRPDDIAGAVVFFAAPESDAITGQTLLVNRGAVSQ